MQEVRRTSYVPQEWRNETVIPTAPGKALALILLERLQAIIDPMEGLCSFRKAHCTVVSVMRQVVKDQHQRQQCFCTLVSKSN